MKTLMLVMLILGGCREKEHPCVPALRHVATCLGVDDEEEIQEQIRICVRARAESGEAWAKSERRIEAVLAMSCAEIRFGFLGPQ